MTINITKWDKIWTKQHMSVPEPGVSLSLLGFGSPFLHIWNEQPDHVHFPA